MLGLTQPPPGARFHGSLPKLGAPVHIAHYADPLKICAYDEPADPAVGLEARRRYLSWLVDPETRGWIQKALPEQKRPLYRPENLDNHPDWPVYVFEREDMADAFNALSGDAEVLGTTIAGGAGAFVLGEWEPLYGRPVTLWPTNRPECIQAMHELARQLQKAGTAVSVICLPQDKPAAWSFLHVVESGWTWEQCLAFVRATVRGVEAALAPIAAAHAATPPALVEPKAVRQQPASQALNARDVWAQIKGLQYAQNGTPYSHNHNVVCAIEAMQGKYADVWYDEFHCKVMTDEQSPRPWRDADTLELTAILQGSYGFSGVRTALVRECVSTVANKRPRHEVREWLDTLVWDESWRLAIAPYEGWGVGISPYASAVFRCFLVAAVARIYKPGCKVDYVPVLEGAQGVKKTTSLLALFGSRWFDNPSAYFGEKDFLQNMNGKWCLELGDLANLKGRHLEVVNATITRQIDTYRASYGRDPGTYPRQSVFAGTIDRKGWNRDEAGGRRWWPLKCGRINLDWITKNRGQLFAEAVHRFKEGQDWWEVPEHDARREQAERQPHDVWTGKISFYIKGKRTVTPAEVLESGLAMVQTKDWNEGNVGRITRVLTLLGWAEQPDHSWTKP